MRETTFVLKYSFCILFVTLSIINLIICFVSLQVMITLFIIVTFIHIHSYTFYHMYSVIKIAIWKVTIKLI